MATAVQTRLVNLGLALFLFAIIASWATTWTGERTQIALIPVMGMTAVLGVRALFRTPARGRDGRWWVWVVCVLSVIYVYGYSIDPAKGMTLFAIFWIRQSLASLALLTLGESYAMLPALRQVRTRFPYGLVRHPVYACYVLTDLCIVLLDPAPANVIVAAVGVTVFWIRSTLEERVLSEDPAYQEYMRTVRWRFVPGLV